MLVTVGKAEAMQGGAEGADTHLQGKSVQLLPAPRETPSSQTQKANESGCSRGANAKGRFWRFPAPDLSLTLTAALSNETPTLPSFGLRGSPVLPAEP